MSEHHLDSKRTAKEGLRHMSYRTVQQFQADVEKKCCIVRMLIKILAPMIGFKIVAGQ